MAAEPNGELPLRTEADIVASRQVVLQRERRLVFHVHLDRHQEGVPHAEDRDAIHHPANAVRSDTPSRVMR